MHDAYECVAILEKLPLDIESIATSGKFSYSLNIIHRFKHCPSIISINDKKFQNVF